MTRSHRFAEEYGGLLAYGLDRKTDEDTLICYLQRFSDDALMKAIIPRLSDDEISGLFDTVTGLMRAHLSEAEYHRLFLKERSGAR